MSALADSLVRDRNVPFRTAHEITGRMMAASQREPRRRLAELLSEVSRALFEIPLTYTPSETARAIVASRESFAHDTAWLRGRRERLVEDGQRLGERSRAL